MDQRLAKLIKCERAIKYNLLAHPAMFASLLQEIKPPEPDEAMLVVR